MPNWCRCVLNIAGPDEELLKFLETVETGNNVFDFNLIIPCPEHFGELNRPFKDWTNKPPEEMTGLPPTDSFNQAGHEWCLANWGTKSNATSAWLRENRDY